MKIFFHTLAAVLLVAASTSPAHAGGNNNARKAIERANKENAKRDQEREARKKVNEEIKEYMADMDKNKNNMISQEEFLSDKDNDPRDFAEADKNKDRSLSKSEVKELLGLD